MTEYNLLGLFHEATPTADTLDQLRKLGIPDEQITVMSSVPYQPEMLGRHPIYDQLVPTALVGALSGLLAGLFLTVVTPLLYTVMVGGQPVVPIPPSLIILFEFTMLGTMVATFAGLLAKSRFPLFGRQVYDYRITEGHIGVLARVDEAQVEQATSILEANGAHHMQRLAVQHPIRRHYWVRWAFVIVFLFIPTAIGLLLAYSFLAIPLPNQMVDQSSIAYEQGPRLAAPAEAVPIQGPALIAGQPATEPVSATANSLQRGQVLFDIHCALCHGQKGLGNGPLSGRFAPQPANLTGSGVQDQADTDLFLVITQGRGLMSNMVENLDPIERWDVINYVRSLKE